MRLKIQTPPGAEIRKLFWYIIDLNTCNVQGWIQTYIKGTLHSPPPHPPNFLTYNRPQKWQILKPKIYFMELPPLTSLDSTHAFCGLGREHAKCVLEPSRHFSATLTVCAPSGRHKSYAISLALSKDRLSVMYVSFPRSIHFFAKDITETTQIICSLRMLICTRVIQ
jgi:hypothetical protein